MKKTIRIIMMALFGVLIIFGIFMLPNPRQRVFAADFKTGLFYLNLYQKILSDSKETKLLESLIVKNDDLHSLNLIAYYANQNTRCDLLSLLEARLLHLQSLNRDSIWSVEINSSYYRESSQSMLNMGNGLFEKLIDLRQKCPSR